MVALRLISLLAWASLSATAKKVIVDNVSPMILYNPPLVGRDTYVQNDRFAYTANEAPTAWNTTFPGAKYTLWAAKNLSDPHFTWATAKDDSAAPSLELSFVGTAITLLGPEFKAKDAVGAGSAELKVDNSDQNAVYCKESAFGDSRMTCEVSDLPFGRHTAKVTIQTGSFSIGHFEIETGRDE